MWARWKPEVTEKLLARAEDYVREVDAREEGYYVTLDVRQLMRGLVSVIFGETTPRVAVLTRESIIQQPAPDPAVQTALAAVFLDYGFQVVDVEQRQASLAREQSFQAAAGDAKLMINVANELDADILVLGESFAEETRGRDGFTARVEYRIVEAATGRVIGSISQTLKNLDAASPLAAGKLALEKGTQETCTRMCSQTLIAYGKPVHRLRVFKVPSLTVLKTIQRSLAASLPGCSVTIEQMHTKGAEASILAVTAKQYVDEVAEAVEAIESPKMTVTSLECRNIVSEIVLDK